MVDAGATQVRPPVVAIDGPAGSGKSTVAQEVARRTGLQFISSGAMYRAVALQALRCGVAATDRTHLIDLAASLSFEFFTDEHSVVHVVVDGEDVTAALRDPAVGQIASVVATIPELRAHLVAKQQAYGERGGVIMEGRDIQTVVFPDADIKIFLLASDEERARRRWRELVEQGERIDFSTVLHEVRERDQRDTEREASPLLAAPDAVIVDTDGRTVDEVVTCVHRLVDTWRQHPTLHGDALARTAGCDLTKQSSSRIGKGGRTV
jgi:cytidylate kinase